MHVALFTDFHPTTVGGIQTSVQAQRRGLERLGHRVTVFTAPPPESTESDPDVIVLSSLGGVLVNGFAMVVPTRDNNRLIDGVFDDRGPIDIVHAHTTYGVAAAGAKAARRNGIPLMQTIHSRDDVFIQHTSPAPYPTALAMRALHSLVVPHRGRMPRNPESGAARHAWRTVIAQAQAADTVIVTTEHFARRLYDHSLDRPLQVISNGVDDDLLDIATATEDRSAADPLRVLWCARLSPEKRPLAALEAVLRVPNCTLDMYGDGDLLARARTRVYEHGAGDRVRLHGAVSQAECVRAMRAHDVLLFPSMGFDTQGMALLEAIAVGLPVLYCDPDLAESVPAGGSVATGASVSAMADTLRELAVDHGRLARLREAAARADSARQSRLIPELVDVYTEAITAAGQRRSVMPRSIEEIPDAPGAIPLLGHSLAALRDSLGFMRSLGKVGPVVRVRLGPQPAYVLTTPDLIRDVGFGTAGEFHRDDLQEAIHEVIRDASNVLTGQPHELRRRMIAPALRQRRLHEYAAITADIANSWAEALPAGPTVNLMGSAHNLILSTITSTLFTADFGARAHREVQRNIPWLLGQVIRRGALPSSVQRVRILANYRFANKAANLRREIRHIVAAYRNADRDFHDVLSALVQHTDPETGTQLTDEEIVDELILMLAAGVGSTASILAWVWHQIMRDPDIAAAVRTEIDEVIGDEQVGIEHIEKLPYLRLVITETLRFRGPWVSMQNADGAVSFGELTLPDGAVIVYSPYLVHHDPRYYRDPDIFDPQRWAPGRVEQIDKKAMLPFGVGSRHCPGNSFAQMSITLATAALFSRWQPVPEPHYRVRVSSGDFVASPSRLPVRLRPAP